jgi:hypothetical protein
MRDRLFAAFLACLLPAAAVAVPRTAAADRFTFGVSVGQRDDRDGRDRGVFARVRVFRQLGMQVEMSRGDDGNDNVDARATVDRLAGTLVLDLSSHGRLTPFLLAGVATERTRTTWTTRDARDRELGAGLSVRIADDLHLSADARIGERRDVEPQVYYDTPPTYPVRLDPFGSGASTGYTVFRVAVGISF